MKYLYLSVCVFVLFIKPNILFSQESLNSSGGGASSKSGSVSYSLGQFVYSEVQSSSGSIIQGVQHPNVLYEYFDEDSLKNLERLDILFVVYPNPTTEFLYLYAKEYDTHNYFCTLSDLRGSIVAKGGITSLETRIDMRYLTSSAYILTIYNKKSRRNKKLKTFKVVKK